MQQLGVFSYIWVEDRVPPGYPLRGIRKIIDQALKSLNGALGATYVKPAAVPWSRRSRSTALLLQVFYSIGSERQLMEQLGYSLTH